MFNGSGYSRHSVLVPDGSVIRTLDVIPQCLNLCVWQLFPLLMGVMITALPEVTNLEKVGNYEIFKCQTRKSQHKTKSDYMSYAFQQMFSISYTIFQCCDIKEISCCQERMVWKYIFRKNAKSTFCTIFYWPDSVNNYKWSRDNKITQKLAT